MWRIFLTQFVTILLLCNESFATHELFRVLMGLPSTFEQRQIYVQPQQQLIVYPQIHQAPMPQFYQSPQNLFTPHNSYSTSQFILHKPTGSFYDPVVSYFHHQNPYQTSSYMNFNLGKKLSSRKPEDESEKNMDKGVKASETVAVKSEVESNDNNREEENKKEIQKEMVITPDNLIETTTMLEIMKDTIENHEKSTTDNVSTAEFLKKM